MVKQSSCDGTTGFSVTAAPAGVCSAVHVKSVPGQQLSLLLQGVSCSYEPVSWSFTVGTLYVVLAKSCLH